MRKLRVLYVMSSVKLGGSQKSLLMLLHGLSKDKFERIIVCPCEGFLTGELKKTGERVIIIEDKSRFGLLSLCRLAKVLKKEKIDIMHLYASRTKAIVAKVAGGIPVVERINMTRDRRILCPCYFRLIDNFMLKFVDRIITVSKALEDSLVKRGIDRNKIVTIRNGVDFERFGKYSEKSNTRKEFSIDHGNRVIGTICRLAKQKGLEYLLRAMVIVLRDYPSTRLLIIGDGRLRERLQNLALRLQVDKNVIFTGAREDIPELLSIMEVFVLASLWEPLANTILEAHAACIPVVATNVDGSPEVIINNKTGLLVEPGNSKELANAILCLLRNRGKAEEMAKLAKERVMKKFRIEDMIEKTENVYLELSR